MGLGEDCGFGGGAAKDPKMIRPMNLRQQSLLSGRAWICSSPQTIQQTIGLADIAFLQMTGHWNRTAGMLKVVIWKDLNCEFLSI